MINPYLASRLKHARRCFSKQGQHNLARATFVLLGQMADTMTPDESEAIRLIRLAFGNEIHA